MIIRRIGLDRLEEREWLVTNGLGGYASNTICGFPTRKYHGYLTASLPKVGRVQMFNALEEEAQGARLSGAEPREGEIDLSCAQRLAEFRLEMGLPVWTFRVGESAIEKRVWMGHQRNTVYLRYRHLSGPAVELRLRPALHFHRHLERRDPTERPACDIVVTWPRIEIRAEDALATLRVLLDGPGARISVERARFRPVFYRIEHERGYDAAEVLSCPGWFGFDLEAGGVATLVASTEAWEAMIVRDALELELARRARLVEIAHPAAPKELVLAADQFIVVPNTRQADLARAQSEGETAKSIIAGYPWFTDWGRDTMISLEGLALIPGRTAEAGSILREFARHARHGLIPNLFPEGAAEGRYHTADATLWFLHALDRHAEWSKSRALVDELLPLLEDIVEHHVRGTKFRIGVDPKDGLLSQGEEGYQLTWMDAKVGDWVVTPRRGKAVEINALWYHALKLMEEWTGKYGDLAARVFESFNRRFWNGGALFDVIDGPDGNDPALRPNQIYAISLPHPVLDRARWEPVLSGVERALLTPVGLRSLAPGHPDYKSRYFGDLRARDAAYHQGTVWAFLAGPYVDACLRVWPDRPERARKVLEGFEAHLDEACIGTVSEIFDAEAPFTPRGCAAQAWSVAELIRAWVRLSV